MLIELTRMKDQKVIAINADRLVTVEPRMTEDWNGQNRKQQPGTWLGLNADGTHGIEVVEEYERVIQLCRAVGAAM